MTRIQYGLIATAFLLTGLAGMLQAQEANEMLEQQLEAMRQMMEAAGMSEEEIAKNQAMARGALQPMAEQQAAEDASEAAAFERETADTGFAHVSILDKNLVLRITKCEPSSRDFRFEAHDGPPDKRGTSSLTVSGEGHYDRTRINLMSPGVGFYEVHIRPQIAPQQGKFEWSGEAEGDRGRTELRVSLACGGG